MTSDKIRQHHLDRRAILYVRQSLSHQVLHNRESRALQYAMRERLTALFNSRQTRLALTGARPSDRRSRSRSAASSGTHNPAARRCRQELGSKAFTEISFVALSCAQTKHSGSVDTVPEDQAAPDY